MLLLLLFEALDPHISRFFLICDLIVHASNLFVKLFLLEIKLAFKPLFLNFDTFNVALQVDALFVQVFYLALLLEYRLLLYADDVLQRPIALNLISHLSLQIVTSFVHLVQLLHSVVIALLQRVDLLFLLVRVDSQRSQLHLVVI